MVDLHIRRLEQHDPRLGRHVVHDPRSKAFARGLTVDTSTWHDKAIRIYDPSPNPDQPVGNCTTCSKCSQLNAAGNRKKGVVLNMDDSLTMYEYETTIDPFPGYFKRDDPKSEDTGSNGVAACKTAQHFGRGGEYGWFFGGADEIVQHFMDLTRYPIPVSVGTRWDYRMFDQTGSYRGLGFVQPGGGVAGGHQWTIRGYLEHPDALIGRCWWGDFKDFLIKREHLAELLADDGDAHTQVRA